MKVCSTLLFALFLIGIVRSDKYSYAVSVGENAVTVVIDHGGDGGDDITFHHLMRWGVYLSKFEESADPEAAAFVAQVKEIKEAHEADAGQHEGWEEKVCLVTYKKDGKTEEKEFDVLAVDDDGQGTWQLNGSDHTVIINAPVFTSLTMDYPGEENDKTGGFEFWKELEKESKNVQEYENVSDNTMVIAGRGEVTITVTEARRRKMIV